MRLRLDFITNRREKLLINGQALDYSRFTALEFDGGTIHTDPPSGEITLPNVRFKLVSIERTEFECTYIFITL